MQQRSRLCIDTLQMASPGPEAHHHHGPYWAVSSPPLCLCKKPGGAGCQTIAASPFVAAALAIRLESVGAIGMPAAEAAAHAAAASSVESARGRGGERRSAQPCAKKWGDAFAQAQERFARCTGDMKRWVGGGGGEGGLRTGWCLPKVAARLGRYIMQQYQEVRRHRRRLRHGLGLGLLAWQLAGRGRLELLRRA